LHATAKAEADKVPVLQAQFEALHQSSKADHKKAIDELTADLELKHRKELDTIHNRHDEELTGLRAAHETHLSEVNDLHREEIGNLSDGSILREEIRSMKAGFEAEKQEAVNAERASMVEEIRSIQAQHTRMNAELQAQHRREMAALREELATERANAINAAISNIRPEYEAERTKLVNSLQETQKKADGEMKTLSDAHSAKTTLLENQVNEARAAQKAAEEKAKKAANLQEELASKSKDLDQAKLELETVKRRLQELEIERIKYFNPSRFHTNGVGWLVERRHHCRSWTKIGDTFVGMKLVEYYIDIRGGLLLMP